MGLIERIKRLFRTKDTIEDDEFTFMTDDISLRETPKELSLWLGTLKMEIGGVRWEWHKYDVDPFPSYPHLHGINERNYKLNIYTGEIFGIKERKIIGSVSKKEMRKLWTNMTFRKYVDNIRSEYYNNISDGKQFNNLPDIPNFE